MKHNENGLQRPSVHCIWYYFFALNKNYFMHMLYVYILQMVPAMILDIVSTTLGKTPILWKTYRKIHRFTGIISYFSMKEFKFDDNNVDSMWEKMGAKDRQLFDFNIASLNWKSTISNGILGLRLYLVNDPIETLPEAKKRFQNLKLTQASNPLPPKLSLKEETHYEQPAWHGT
uniref:Fatty acyl-CoA reductase C-terminal domain-containing protein n=1 Tax=Timema bartmani TaxID=61472 RepID=A0A7R9EYT0_9NEOP|nr:unnamed protein product [Timema bartmani]